MQSQFVEKLMCLQKHYTVSKSEPWDFYRSFLQTSEPGNHREKLQTNEPTEANSIWMVNQNFGY